MLNVRTVDDELHEQHGKTPNAVSKHPGKLEVQVEVEPPPEEVTKTDDAAPDVAQLPRAISKKPLSV